MIKAIFLDLDGVCIDACNWHFISLNKALQQLCNYSIDYNDHITNFNGLPTKVKLSILEQRGIISQSQFDQIFNLKQQYTKETILENAHIDYYKIQLHEKTKSMGIISACITNAIRETAELMLKSTGQLEYMDFLITNEDVQNNKPAPDCYLKAIEKVNLQKNEILIVEDSPKGYQAAIASGCHVLKVNNCYDVTFERILFEIIKIEEYIQC